MKLLRPALPLLMLSLLGACVSQKPVGDDYYRPLRLDFIDRDGKEIWSEALTVGDALDDDGYRFNSLVTGRICVGDGAEACKHERDVDVRLTIHARELPNKAFGLRYQGQVDVDEDRDVVMHSEGVTLKALPTETRYPAGELELSSDRAAEVELLQGLRLLISLPTDTPEAGVPTP